MIVHWHRLSLALLAGSLWAASARPAAAFEPPTESLAARAQAADAVVLATVRDVTYRLSAPATDQPALPFTFVTFEVERVLRGQVLSGPLVLRFQGGSFPDGRFFDDPTAPLFDAGERSVLLVSRNGELDVPLAGWRFGRLRVIDGRVYDDFGKPLAIVDGRHVRMGRTVFHEEVAQHRVAGDRFFNPRRREVPPRAPDVGPAGATPANATSVDDAIPLARFVDWLSALPAGSAGRVVANQEPDKPFASRALRPVSRRPR